MERRHQEINTKLQEDELATMASLTALSNYRSALTSNAGSIQHLVTTAPDAFLLGMLEKLALRLDHLEFQSRATGKVKAVVDVNFKPQTLALVKKVISRLGHDDARVMCVFWFKINCPCFLFYLPSHCSMNDQLILA